MVEIDDGKKYRLL